MATGGKIFGAVLGWAFMGPLGGLLGAAFGHFFDRYVDDRIKDPRLNSASSYYNRVHSHGKKPPTSAGDFHVSLLVLSAAMMKADGKVLMSELNYVKTYLQHQFGEETATEYLLALRDITKQDINVKSICYQIKFYMDHSNRLLLMQYLLGIAKADNDLHGSEVYLIMEIGRHLGISEKDIHSMLGIQRGAGKASYEILEISEDVSDQEVKKAYRRMANKYHPDKVSNLGAEHKQAAEERFIEVQKAYEVIKKSRGMK